MPSKAIHLKEVSPGLPLCLSRARERTATVEAMRQELEASRQAAKAREEDKRIAAEKHREVLRARASVYRERKEVLKTSAYSR